MVYLTVNGKLKTLKELSIEYNIPLQLIRGRYANGIRNFEELIISEDLRKVGREK
jgi:hypothetical protein